MPYKNPRSPKLVARRLRLRALAYKENHLRQCSKCKLTMSVVDEETGFKNFTAHAVATDGLRPYCRFCERKYDTRKRVINEEKTKIYRRLRRARRKTACQLTPLRKKWWIFDDVRRYFGFRTMTMEALLLRRPCMTIPKEMRFPPGSLKYDASRPCAKFWPRELVLRWERERFLPNAALFFAHIRAWAEDQEFHPISSYQRGMKQYRADRKRRGNNPAANAAWCASQRAQRGLPQRSWIPRKGWRPKKFYRKRR